MNDTEYKPNSYKHRVEQAESTTEEKKKVDKVVRGAVKTKKQSGAFKSHLAEDLRSIGSYLFTEKAIPTAKKLLYEIISNGADMLIFGDSAPRERRNGASNYVSYRDYSKRGEDRPYRESNRPRGSYSYDDIILESRAEADEVLERMSELIDTYGMVSVGDLYDLVGIQGNYTDNNYGWVDLRSAEPARMRDGWMLRLPKARPLK